MGQAMVAMKASKALSKGGIADALSAKTGLKRKQCTNILNALADVGATEVKKNGKFTVPALCFIKTRLKPATKAGKREMFGQTVGEGDEGDDGGKGPPCISSEECGLKHGCGQP